MLVIEVNEGKTYLNFSEFDCDDKKMFIMELEDYSGEKIMNNSYFDGDQSLKIKDFMVGYKKYDENEVEIVIVKAKKQNNDEEEEIIDTQYIELKFTKVKRFLKTYILGLKNYFDNDQIAKLCVQLKKSLGANAQLKDGSIIIMNGDYSNDSAKKKIIKTVILKHVSDPKVVKIN